MYFKRYQTTKIKVKCYLKLFKLSLQNCSRLTTGEKYLIYWGSRSSQSSPKSLRGQDHKIILALFIYSCTNNYCINFFLATFREIPLWVVVQSTIFCKVIKEKSAQILNISKTNGIKPDPDLSIVIKYFSSPATSPATAATPAHGADE